MTEEEAHQRADELLRLGDSLAKTKPAESRHILRECRRWRVRARAIRDDTRPAPK